MLPGPIKGSDKGTVAPGARPNLPTAGLCASGVSALAGWGNSSEQKSPILLSFAAFIIILSFGVAVKLLGRRREGRGEHRPHQLAALMADMAQGAWEPASWIWT